jgi:hypothetical protein
VEHQLGRDHHERQRRVVPVRVQRDDEQRDVLWTCNGGTSQQLSQS